MSGIHLIIKSEPNDTIIDDFIITINHIDHISNYKLLVSHVHDDTVYWYKCVIISEINLNLNKFKFFLQNGFNLFPRDQFGSKQISILKLALVSRHDYFSEVVHSKMSPFILGDVNVGDEIKIISSPFSFTNSLIFNNFSSIGIINYLLSEKFYFTDVKYLENMNGGGITNGDISVGLVLGNLRKLNGDGDLTVLISWRYILQLIKHFLPRQPHENDKTHSFISEVSHSCDSVIPLIITDTKGVVSWGTCVYYNDKTLITNKHVIESYIAGAKCQILFHNQVIELNKELDLVIIPNKDIDLAFIFINPSCLAEYSIVVPKFEVDVGDIVYTTSFGLFFNPGEHKPIQCKGTINCIYKLPVKENSDLEVNSVIIASASTWNGSSGGGLFSSKGEFIGLICSNAQVKSPVIATDTNESFEKLSKFSFVLPVDIIEYFYNEITNGSSSSGIGVNANILDIWKLKSFHHDIIIEPAKL
ncbi:hypothetical protein JA1_000063 [Spathaspora sp. JA1]|nr:hypothetical protein JA1_000063 [Spathaspora sp. JA1]